MVCLFTSSAYGGLYIYFSFDSLPFFVLATRILEKGALLLVPAIFTRLFSDAEVFLCPTLIC